MSDVPVQQHHRPAWPAITQFFAGLGGLGPTFDGHPIKVEDKVEDGRYELQAELPGVDPSKDVDVTVRDGVLTIKAERSEKKEANGRSEFTYGSFTRSVSLPAGADEDNIKASYDKGILTVSVPLTESQAPAKRVAVESAS